jgi:hypothetical protein
MLIPRITLEIPHFRGNYASILKEEWGRKILQNVSKWNYVQFLRVCLEYDDKDITEACTVVCNTFVY